MWKEAHKLSGSTGPTAAATPVYHRLFLLGAGSRLLKCHKRNRRFAGMWWQLTHWCRNTRGSNIYAQDGKWAISLEKGWGRTFQYREQQKVFKKFFLIVFLSITIYPVILPSPLQSPPTVHDHQKVLCQEKYGKSWVECDENIFRWNCRSRRRLDFECLLGCKNWLI